MEQPFGVDGYVLTDLIGFGATGEVWRGRDDTTHEPVALKRLWEPASDGLVLRIRQDAAVVSEVAGPHAVRLLEVAVLPRGEVVLVMEEAAGGSLAGLLARRGRLHPSEVVTILGPLAQVLADLHRRGMVHGDLTPNNVVFTADGCPMLSDAGLAVAIGEKPGSDVGFRDPSRDGGAQPTAASDCFGLAALGYAALTGVPPRNASGVIEPIAGRAPWVPAVLAAAIESALAADPVARTDIATFAAEVFSSCAAAPVRLSGPRRTPETERSSMAPDDAPRRRPRGLVLAGVVAAVLGIAALVGIGSARFNTPRASALQPAPASTSSRSSESSLELPPQARDGTDSYRAIVNHLFALRARAFAAGKVSLLHRVYPRISLAWDMESAELGVLQSQHLHTRGFTQHVVSIRTELASPGWVWLTVTSMIPPYSVVDSSGRVVAQRAGRTQHFDIRIERDHGRWRIHAIGRKPVVAPAP